jgi:hypothetical protein
VDGLVHEHVRGQHHVASAIAEIPVWRLEVRRILDVVAAQDADTRGPRIGAHLLDEPVMRGRFEHDAGQWPEQFERYARGAARGRGRREPIDTGHEGFLPAAQAFLLEQRPALESVTAIHTAAIFGIAGDLQRVTQLFLEPGAPRGQVEVLAVVEDGARAVVVQRIAPDHALSEDLRLHVTSDRSGGTHGNSLISPTGAIR